MEQLLAHFTANKQFYEFATQVGTLVIATLAFYVTVFQTYTTHRHNKKLVTPHLGGYWETDHKRAAYIYTIKNNGLGPAIIKKVTYLVDSNPVPGKGLDPIEAVTNTIIGPLDREQSMGHFGINEYVPQQEEKTILELEFLNKEINIDEIVKELQNRAVLLIEYESIVGQKFNFDSRLS